MSTISERPQRVGSPPRDGADPPEEAATVEVAALAALLARPVTHDGPADDDDAENFVGGADPDAADDDAGRAAPVLPRQRDEFVCSRCFLVVHVSQLADSGSARCRDCV